MMTADFSRGLPDLRAGVYRHWKGHFYMVLGYAHDANADALQPFPPVIPEGAEWASLGPLGERAVVVYMGLELTDANTGPRLAVRTAEDFFALVCSICGADWECEVCPPSRPEPVRRFEYMGPAWYGWPQPDTTPSGTRPGPDTAADALPDPGTPEDVQPWAPCGVTEPHEPHGPDAPRPKCPGVPPRHPALPIRPNLDDLRTTCPILIDPGDGLVECGQPLPCPVHAKAEPHDPWPDDEDPPAAYAEGTESGGRS